jgi:hypothetical protein
MKQHVTLAHDEVARILRDIQALAQQEVLIGIPEETTARPGEAITNAELGYLAETGSPGSNVPARPFLIPGVTRAQTAAAVILRAGFQESIDNAQPVQVALDKAGVLAENSVKRWFTDPANGWAPNSAATIARKGSSQPLIDTGELRRSVTHVVVKKAGTDADS